MPDQTISPEQNKQAKARAKQRPFVVAGFVMLCLYAIFDGIPNPPLAVIAALAAYYTLIGK
jgi:hypothetical protein